MILRADARAIPLRDCSVDAIVTDPPYGLAFMGKEWDHGVPGVPFWVEAMRVAKPGAHLVAFGGTRTFHRLTCAIEDAGWEIRDCLCWLYGQGFSKSWNFNTQYEGEWCACNGAGGHQRPSDPLDAGTLRNGGRCARCGKLATFYKGVGTGLKPAIEYIILARKPLVGTVAANVREFGTGGLNIDGCRISTDWSSDPTRRGWQGGKRPSTGPFDSGDTSLQVVPRQGPDNATDRWPPNLCLDEEAAAMLNEQAGERTSGGTPFRRSGMGYHGADGQPAVAGNNGDSGGPSRFFYVSKASRSEREAGCDGLPPRSRTDATGRKEESAGQNHPRCGIQARGVIRNTHPTVKPISLMRWLCRLVTPHGGIILDPFAGSGSTACAAALEGFKYVTLDLDMDYCRIAHARAHYWAAQRKLDLPMQNTLGL